MLHAGQRPEETELARAYAEAGFYAYPTDKTETSGIALMKAQACGCIPVVVRPGQGQLWLPYEPELDYRTFAVSLPFEDIPRLPALLEAIPPAVLRAKREALRALHRRFLWDDEYGQAFEAVREAVLLKVK